MLRAALLAVALLYSGFAPAEKTPATAQKAGDAEQPCSDYEHSFPSCGISKAERNQATQHYKQGLKQAKRGKFEDALKETEAALKLSPRDVVYNAAVKELKEKVAAESLREGNQAVLNGDSGGALKAFRRAVEVAPDNDYAQQRLRDAFPAPEVSSFARLEIESGETRLKPDSGTRSFDFKGSSPELLAQFTKAFGVTAEQQGLTPRTLRLKLDNVGWETGANIVAHLCKVLFIPLDEHRVLIANDTDENRRELTRMVLRTFKVHGGDGSAQSLTDLTTALRVLFDLRFITPNPAQQTIVVRAPQPTMDAVAEFLEGMNQLQPTVMLEIKVFQVSSSFTRDLGYDAPTAFTVFNVGTELNNLKNSSAYQEAIAALQASGQTVNAQTILAALLASSGFSSSLLSQPFATFGGGITLSAVTIPSTSLHFSGNRSLARTVDQILLRAADGKAATMKIGERYPIVNIQYAASNTTSSLLNSLGISTGAVAGATVPSPQVNYEDIGLVLKTTPHVHGSLVSLEYEMTMRALGATQSNGLPLITNREIRGTISTDDDTPVVIAGMVDKDETRSMTGYPVISSIPILGQALSIENKEYNYDELLVVMTPHVVHARSEGTNNWIRVPTNVPK
jgi:tetratricopeptide (TPR) repeat protein